MKRIKFFETSREATAFLKKYKKWKATTDKGHWNWVNFAVYDLKKTHPRRIKTRFFVGDYYEWLEL